ncbi:response regulator [Pontibacter sp. BT310]|jgi:CheY-like chemotaxis protein|uniref:Response regulator n=2 Tax=Hymenobacteraceae TaxID=1853232 RepID=A0ABS6XCX1_9BACT|nr:response regulator [Pontibacter sp. BT310]MBW3365809.1 response regulator [Pontibacter populi]
MPMLDLVLLIDDDDTTNFLNKRLLEEMQVAKEILVFNNGKGAIEYLSEACSEGEASDKRCPDLIFLDIKMPVMDGFSFLDEYQRRNLDSKDHVIIMMLTSSASFYDLERLKNYSRVKKHYSKTLTKHDVQEVLQQFFDKN